MKADRKVMTGQTCKVLVVDDDAAIAELMRDFLEAEGYVVEVASDAQTAFAAWQRTPVDCLLLDVMMPGQTGFDLCRRIRETSDVPILFLSGHSAHVRVRLGRCEIRSADDHYARVIKQQI